MEARSAAGGAGGVLGVVGLIAALGSQYLEVSESGRDAQRAEEYRYLLDAASDAMDGYRETIYELREENLGCRFHMREHALERRAEADPLP